MNALTDIGHMLLRTISQRTLGSDPSTNGSESGLPASWNVGRSSTWPSLNLHNTSTTKNNNSKYDFAFDSQLKYKEFRQNVINAFEAIGFTCDVVDAALFAGLGEMSQSLRHVSSADTFDDSDTASNSVGSDSSFERDSGVGLFHFDPSHFYAFGMIDPVGLIVVSFDRINHRGLVRSKLGVFCANVEGLHSRTNERKMCNELLAKFISQNPGIWAAAEDKPDGNSSVGQSSPKKTSETESHARSYSTNESINVALKPSEFDLNVWRRVFDSFLNNVRYTDEMSADQSRYILELIGRCFEFKQPSYVVIDVYDTDSEPVVPVEAYGLPAKDFISFSHVEFGQVLTEMGEGKKRYARMLRTDDSCTGLTFKTNSPSLELNVKNRPTSDNVSMREGLAHEIQDNETNFEACLKMLIMVHDTFQQRAQTYEKAVVKPYHVQRSFPRVEKLQALSSKLLDDMVTMYFKVTDPKLEVLIDLLDKYADDFTPLVLDHARVYKSSLDFVTGFGETNPVFQTELNAALDQAEAKYGRRKDAATLLHLPLGRLTYLREAVTRMLEATPITHPLSTCLEQLGEKLHAMSLLLEAEQKKFEEISIMHALAASLKLDNLASASRVYLNDYPGTASHMNVEAHTAQSAMDQALMLLNDEVLLLAKVPEKGGGSKCQYQVLAKFPMHDILDIDHNGNELVFALRSRHKHVLGSTIFRFVPKNSGQYHQMYHEIRHVWIANNWAHSFDTAAHKRLPLYVMQRDDFCVYYRVLKSETGVHDAQFARPKVSNISVLCSGKNADNQKIIEAVKATSAYLVSLSPGARTNYFDFSFRVRSKDDPVWTRMRVGAGNRRKDLPGTMHIIRGVENLAHAVFMASKSAAMRTDNPTSPERTQIRQHHLENIFTNLPPPSFFQKVSLHCKRLSVRSRRQSNASIFGLDDDGNPIQPERREDSSPERAYQDSEFVAGHPRYRTMSIESNKSTHPSKNIRNVGISSSPTRPRSWFQRKEGTSPVRAAVPMPKDIAKASDLELLQFLCKQIEARGEIRAYNNATVALAKFSTSEISKSKCVALAKRSKAAHEFILALRVLLCVPVNESTFSEQFILPSSALDVMLSLERRQGMNEVLALKKVCVQQGLTTSLYFASLFGHLNRVTTNKTGTTSSAEDIASFLCACIFPTRAGKDNPHERRMRCLHIMVMLIEQFQKITNGCDDYSPSLPCQIDIPLQPETKRQETPEPFVANGNILDTVFSACKIPDLDQGPIVHEAKDAIPDTSVIESNDVAADVDEISLPISAFQMVDHDSQVLYEFPLLAEPLKEVGESEDSALEQFKTGNILPAELLVDSAESVNAESLKDAIESEDDMLGPITADAVIPTELLTDSAESVGKEPIENESVDINDITKPLSCDSLPSDQIDTIAVDEDLERGAAVEAKLSMSNQKSESSQTLVSSDIESPEVM
ncbi:hypothetical protein HDU81_005753 [Chytriomyces hyalinus]|nr:hypothetical protein HDU81_005753 [Chytriomyces hyalinus]